MLKRLIGTVVALVSAALLITIAVTNRKVVTLVLDPFAPADPVVAIDMPFYLHLFAMLFIGILAGGLAMWWSQGKWRRAARQKSKEAAKWQGEAMRLQRERDNSKSDVRALTVAR